MNLGFYVETTSDQIPVNKQIYEFLNSDVEDLTDKTLFFNSVEKNEINPNFGLFNATELWAFQGTLVVTDIQNLAYANNVTNNIDLVYLHSTSNKPLDLIVYTLGLQVFSMGEQLAIEYKRLTGKSSQKIENILELWEKLNEHQEDN